MKNKNPEFHCVSQKFLQIPNMFHVELEAVMDTYFPRVTHSLRMRIKAYLGLKLKAFR